MRRAVVDLKDARPIWRVPPDAIGRIRSFFPESWDVVAVEAATDGHGDGGRGATPEALEAVRGAEIYFGYGVPVAVLEIGAPTLRWVHTGAAGVRGSLTPEMRRSDVVFTNSAGVQGPPMAETVIAVILHFARGLDWAVRAQAERRWGKPPFDAADSAVREVAGSTVGVVGYGGIGREVGARARALGARVLALKRRLAAVESGVELLYGETGLRRLLAESDYVVVTVPETDETEGLIDASALATMKPGAVLVNVARGGIVDEAALVAELRRGRLRGAALDVFSKEPLPPESPLWAVQNLLITPHVSAYSRRYWVRETELIGENVRRYLQGRRLLNVVDCDAGY